MTDVLGLVAVLPASAGACCTVGAWRPGRAVDVVAAITMVAAMADGLLTPRVLPGAAWFLVLVVLAVALAAVDRSQRNGARADRSARLHAALGLLVMGAMGVGMSHDGSMPGMHDHGGPVAATWAAVLAGLTAGYLVLTVAEVRGCLRERERERAQERGRRRAGMLPLLETVTMGTAVVVMAVGMLS